MRTQKLASPAWAMTLSSVICQSENECQDLRLKAVKGYLELLQIVLTGVLFLLSVDQRFENLQEKWCSFDAFPIMFTDDSKMDSVFVFDSSDGSQLILSIDL